MDNHFAGSEGQLRALKKDLTARQVSLFAYLALPIILVVIFLFVPNGPPVATWPWILIWLVPIAVVAMIAWALRDLARTRRFWLAMGPRLAGARYYASGRYAAASVGVVAIFDNHLVIAEWLGLRFLLFLDDGLRILAPMPDGVNAWFQRSQRIRARISELQGGGRIAGELQRIRETLGGRKPGRLAAKLELLFTERSKPVDSWPDVRYAISMTISVSSSSARPEVFLAELDDVARFLSEAASAMAHMPADAGKSPQK